MIHKHRKHTHFVTLHNATATDSRLSFTARGILVMMLSHPADWTTRVGWFEKQTPKEGREAIKSAIGELEAAGYCKREEKKVSGQFSTYEWDWTDEPFNFEDSNYSTDDGEPSTASRKRSTDDGEPATTKEVQEQNKKKEDESSSQARVANPPRNQNTITPNALKTLWNTLVPSLNPLREVSAKHLRAAKARGNESKLAEVFTMVEASDFLSGRGERSSHTGWKCTLDWVLKPDKFANIVNGDYNTNKPRTNPQRSDSANAPGRYD